MSPKILSAVLYQAFLVLTDVKRGGFMFYWTARYAKTLVPPNRTICWNSGTTEPHDMLKLWYHRTARYAKTLVPPNRTICCNSGTTEPHDMLKPWYHQQLHISTVYVFLLVLSSTFFRFVAILRQRTPTFHRNMPKHVAAKKQKEYTDCRTVHLLALPAL